MINSIEIKQQSWNSEKEKYETEYKTITRDEYSGDFDDFILENMSSWDVENYAENELDMMKEDDCTCNCSIQDYSENFLIHHLEEAGHKVIKCQTITDSMRYEKLKEIMEL